MAARDSHLPEQISPQEQGEIYLVQGIMGKLFYYPDLSAF